VIYKKLGESELALKMVDSYIWWFIYRYVDIVYMIGSIEVDVFTGKLDGLGLNGVYR